jgi:hypothetical protein
MEAAASPWYKKDQAECLRKPFELLRQSGSKAPSLIHNEIFHHGKKI